MGICMQYVPFIFTIAQLYFMSRHTIIFLMTKADYKDIHEFISIVIYLMCNIFDSNVDITYESKHLKIIKILSFIM